MKKKQYEHLTEHDRIRIVLRLALTSSRGWSPSTGGPNSITGRMALSFYPQGFERLPTCSGQYMSY